ncbi:MAG: clostripain-related cysteine peptidase [Elusimicrobia bacterium]|nr:clostripain-related cysteine peptidase [Elusimicrobiota bacterium]
MRIVKIASIAAILSIGLGIFLIVPAHKQTVNVPGDLRDAPGSGSALEQIGFDGNSGLAIPNPGKAAARIAPAPAARSKAARQTKEWTVMYYSTTKDKLRYSLVWQLLEMKKTGSTDSVNVVVEAAFPVKSADGVISTPTVRMALGKGSPEAEMDKYIKLLMSSQGGPIDAAVLKPFAADIVKSENNVDTGDWRRVAAFGRWAKEEYPARRYAFVIYGHGNGFFDDKKPVRKGAPPGKATLRDTDTGNYVTTPELSQLMAVIGKVDIFVMQSCLMQMAEVAYQIKDYADVIVGSSELLWSVGYDLGGMVKTLDDNPGISTQGLGASLADSYVQGVKDYKLSGGHSSVLLTAKLPAFAEKLDAWVDAVTALNDKKIFLAGVKETARFDIFGVTVASTQTLVASRVSISGDLYDFVRIVNEGLPQDNPATLPARLRGTELMSFIANELVYKYAYTGKSNTGVDFSRAHGLSIHIPPVALIGGNIEGFNALCETNYWDLPFAKETKWGSFLSWLYGRKPR